jgi:hypothetical protein
MTDSPRQPFSRRHGYQPSDREIVIREEAGCLGATEHKTGLRPPLDPTIPNHIPFGYFPTTANDRSRPALTEDLRTGLEAKNQQLRSELRASSSS